MGSKHADAGFSQWSCLLAIDHYILRAMKILTTLLAAISLVTLGICADNPDVAVALAVADTAADTEEKAGASEEVDDPWLVTMDNAALVKALGADHAADRIAAEGEVEDRFARDLGQDELVKLLLDCYQKSDDPEQWVRARALLVIFVSKHSDFGPNFGFLGVQHRLVEFPDSNGKIVRAVRVDSVVDDSPASRAGLKVGDRVKMIDKLSLDSQFGDLSFYRYIFNKGGGAKIMLKVVRVDAGEIDLPAQLGRQPARFFQGLTPERRSGPELFREWLGDKGVAPRE